MGVRVRQDRLRLQSTDHPRSGQAGQGKKEKANIWPILPEIQPIYEQRGRCGGPRPAFCLASDQVTTRDRRQLAAVARSPHLVTNDGFVLAGAGKQAGWSGRVCVRVGGRALSVFTSSGAVRLPLPHLPVRGITSYAWRVVGDLMDREGGQMPGCRCWGNGGVGGWRTVVEGWVGAVRHMRGCWRLYELSCRLDESLLMEGAGGRRSEGGGGWWRYKCRVHVIVPGPGWSEWPGCMHRDGDWVFPSLGGGSADVGGFLAGILAWGSEGDCNDDCWHGWLGMCKLLGISFV